MCDTVSLSLLIHVLLVLTCLPHEVLLLRNTGYPHILEHRRDEWQDERSALTSSPEEAGLFSLTKYIASNFHVEFFCFFSKFASLYPTEHRINFLILFTTMIVQIDEPTHLPSTVYCNSKLCTILLCSK